MFWDPYYPMNGILIPRRKTRSLRIITTPNSMSARKKTKFIRPSTVENFSSLMRKSFCKITAQNLPPSTAGIGRILKIANARESIPPKPRKISGPKASKSFSPNFTAPTGQVSWLRADFVSFALNEKSFEPIRQREVIVRSRSAFISLNPASIALPSQNFTGRTSISPSWRKMIPSLQSDSQENFPSWREDISSASAKWMVFSLVLLSLERILLIVRVEIG